MAEDLYVVAGRNLLPATRELIERLAGDEPHLVMWREEIASRLEEASWSGPTMVMQGIAPRVWGEAGRDDEALLFAVLATYGRISDDVPWAGTPEHLQNAFMHMRKVGEREAAKLLRADVRNRATREEHADVAYLRERSLGKDPAALAAHRRNLAQGDQRDLRAANLLHPLSEDELWTEFLSG
jgi:hypothetical protein